MVVLRGQFVVLKELVIIVVILKMQFGMFEKPDIIEVIVKV